MKEFSNIAKKGRIWNNFGEAEKQCLLLKVIYETIYVQHTWGFIGTSPLNARNRGKSVILKETHISTNNIAGTSQICKYIGSLVAGTLNSSFT